MTAASAVAVVGAGAGGMAIAADLTARGERVHLFELPEFAANLDAIRDSRGIDRRDRSGSQTVMPAVLTTDPREALNGVELVHVAIPAFGHERIVDAIAPHLRSGQFVLFNTGYWAALRFRARLAANGRAVVPAESTLLVYAVRKIDRASIFVDGVKDDYPVAALPASQTGRLLELVRRGYPQARPMRSVLEVSLENLNPVFHPAITLLNAGELERSGDDFAFYSAGCTPAVGRVIDAVDSERLAVAAALGLADLRSVAQWLASYYGARGSSAYAAIQSCPAYRDFRWPPSTAIRYVDEDVPFAFVPLVRLAEHLNVPTPVIRGLVDLCGRAFGRDYWAEGPDVHELGIDRVSVTDLRRLANGG